MKRKEHLWSVSIFGITTQVIAKTKQAAVRAAIRYCIKHKLISQPPKTNNDWYSSWEDVIVFYQGKA